MSARWLLESCGMIGMKMKGIVVNSVDYNIVVSVSCSDYRRALGVYIFTCDYPS